MTVITNKWVEKERKKKPHETAPAFASVHTDERDPYNMKKPAKRHTVATRSTMTRTLRGTRK